MASVDLIARENEFIKLNKQLEKKTESLMKEIEEVMQKPDIFSTPKLKVYNNQTARKHHCTYSSPSPQNSARSNNLSNTKPKDLWKKNINKTKIVPDLKNSMHVNKQYSESASERPHSTDLNSAEVISAEKVVCDCCVQKEISTELGFLYAFVTVSVKDNVLPQSFLKGRITVESVCKCLSSKIRLMQEQLDNLQSTIEKKNKQCEAHLTHIAELESERLALLNTANSTKSETADMKAKYLAIQNRLNDKDRLYKEQRSATDKLTVEIKQYKCKNSSLEARCASQEEAIAALRQQVEAAKLSEKEYRMSTRSLSSSHEATIKHLESQLTAARAHLSKQRALIANLRAQRSLVAGERAVQALNDQYSRLLEHGIE